MVATLLIAMAFASVEQTERADCPAALAAYERYVRTHADGSAIAVDRAVHASLPCARRYAGVERARLLYGLADIELGLVSVHDADPNVELPEVHGWLREALPLASGDPQLAGHIREMLRTLE